MHPDKLRVMINQMHLSQRFLLLLLVASAWHVAANAETSPPEQSRWQSLANPSAPGSLAPRLVQAGDGTVYLSWLQKHTSGRRRLLTKHDIH